MTRWARFRVAFSPVRHATRIAAILLALVLIWAGAVVAALAFGVDASSVDQVTGYRFIHDGFQDFEAADVNGTERLVAGLAGLVVFVLLLVALVKSLPRPRLATSGLSVGSHERGDTVVSMKALERMAEFAVREDPRVESARGRYLGDVLVVETRLAGGDDDLDAVRTAPARIDDELGKHGIRDLPTRVVLVGIGSKKWGIT